MAVASALSPTRLLTRRAASSCAAINGSNVCLGSLLVTCEARFRYAQRMAQLRGKVQINCLSCAPDRYNLLCLFPQLIKVVGPRLHHLLTLR